MPLTQDQEDLEHRLRVEQMETNIEKLRADMAAQQKQLAWETRKFTVSFIAAIAAGIGAGVALTNWVYSRPVPAPAVQVAPAPAPQKG